MTKEYFPETEGRLRMKLHHTGNLTTILTGHGNITAYPNRLHISSEPTCPCGKRDQKTDHIIYDCARLKKERDRLRAEVTKTNVWPASKRRLIKGTTGVFKIY
jgi:hypothetical protein